MVLDKAFIEQLSSYLQQALSDSSSALGIEVTCKDPAEHENFKDVVMCAIGITGVFNGNLTLIVPYATACQLVSKMLCDTYLEVNNDVLDGCREITNMVAGGLKMILSSKSLDISIGLPTSMTGNAMHVRFNPADVNIHQQFRSSTGDLELYLVCRESDSKIPEQHKDNAARKDAASSLLDKLKNNPRLS